MSLADLSQKKPSHAAAPLAERRAVATVAALARAANEVVQGSSDDDILRRMRARPNLLKQGRPPMAPLAGVERMGGSAPVRP